MNKVVTIQDNPEDSPFEELCGKPLTQEQQTEILFNLTNYVETLIAMDRQHKEWLKKQNEETKETA